MDQVNEAVYCAALELVQGIDSCLQSGRHYRSKDGRLLTQLDAVLLALTEDDLMSEQVGILYENTAQLPLGKAIGRAVGQFLQAEHCGGAHHTPAECHLNPFELNGLGKPKARLYGMKLIPNADIPPGRIRICTAAPDKEVEHEPLAA